MVATISVEIIPIVPSFPPTPPNIFSSNIYTIPTTTPTIMDCSVVAIAIIALIPAKEALWLTAAWVLNTKPPIKPIRADATTAPSFKGR